MPPRATAAHDAPAPDPRAAGGTGPAGTGPGGTSPSNNTRPGQPRLGSIDTAVHFGFAVLLVASLVRYVMRHSPADNIPVLGLAAGACLLYLAVAVHARRGRPAVPWMVALAGVWAVLVIAAPSFAWCSFALFFLCRSALTGIAAYVAAGVTAAATAAGLFKLSDGTDLAMLLGPLAVGMMLTLVYDRIQHDAEEQRRLHTQVSLAQEQLAASERRAGTIAERERVSREIHDTITQGLASSLLLLEAAGRAWPGDTARADLGQATALLRGNLSETRSLVHELATPGLDASAATVTLGFLPDAVTLDVYDDGTGFDPAAAAPPSDAGGYGLRAMRQRVEQLGGVFSVESAPGEGTIVAAQLPAPADAEGPGESP